MNFRQYLEDFKNFVTEFEENLTNYINENNIKDKLSVPKPYTKENFNSSFYYFLSNSKKRSNAGLKEANKFILKDFDEKDIQKYKKLHSLFGLYIYPMYERNYFKGDTLKYVITNFINDYDNSLDKKSIEENLLTHTYYTGTKLKTVTINLKLI